MENSEERLQSDAPSKPSPREGGRVLSHTEIRYRSSQREIGTILSKFDLDIDTIQSIMVRYGKNFGMSEDNLREKSWPDFQDIKERKKSCGQLKDVGAKKSDEEGTKLTQEEILERARNHEDNFKKFERNIKDTIVRIFGEGLRQYESLRKDLLRNCLPETQAELHRVDKRVKALIAEESPFEKVDSAVPDESRAGRDEPTKSKATLREKPEKNKGKQVESGTSTLQAGSEINKGNFGELSSIDVKRKTIAEFDKLKKCIQELKNLGEQDPVCKMLAKSNTMYKIVREIKSVAMLNRDNQEEFSPILKKIETIITEYRKLRAGLEAAKNNKGSWDNIVGRLETCINNLTAFFKAREHVPLFEVVLERKLGKYCDCDQNILSYGQPETQSKLEELNRSFAPFEAEAKDKLRGSTKQIIEVFSRYDQFVQEVQNLQQEDPICRLFSKYPDAPKNVRQLQAYGLFFGISGEDFQSSRVFDKEIFSKYKKLKSIIEIVINEKKEKKEDWWKEAIKVAKKCESDLGRLFSHNFNAMFERCSGLYSNCEDKMDSLEFKELKKDFDNLKNRVPENLSGKLPSIDTSKRVLEYLGELKKCVLKKQELQFLSGIQELKTCDDMTYEFFKKFNEIREEGLKLYHDYKENIHLRNQPETQHKLDELDKRFEEFRQQNDFNAISERRKTVLKFLDELKQYVQEVRKLDKSPS
ncbi:MAG TPA: hypothetical protein VK553_02080 [Candidatus Nitrosopolaris rasttigaisensis]|nr:hypothetical protein [Candidatus Nitrosopolaris rasttigaisensis]